MRLHYKSDTTDATRRFRASNKGAITDIGPDRTGSTVVGGDQDYGCVRPPGLWSGIGTWATTDEYGNPETTNTGAITGTGSTAVSGDQNYGWQGGKQRAQDLSGLILMGARLYNPATGQFTSADPDPGGNTTPYTYPQDPINAQDLNGQFLRWLRRVVHTATQMVLDVDAVGPYGAYYGAYHWNRFAERHRILTPTRFAGRIIQRAGLSGDVEIDRLKGESIRDEGVRGYPNPLHSFLPRILRGPRMYFPGIHRNGHIDFAR